MRLGEWRKAAPSKEAVAAKVTAVIDPVLASFGVGDDPDCWVAWGEEPANRYTVLVPMIAGLLTCYVRVNVPGEGPRAAAKLLRWNRVQLGELAIETQSGHRLLSFQVEQLVLRGADKEADRIVAFALDLYAAVDGRPRPERGPASKTRGRGGPVRATTAKGRASASRVLKPSTAAAKTPSARRAGSGSGAT
jgi:hypothetical protein